MRQRPGCSSGQRGPILQGTLERPWASCLSIAAHPKRGTVTSTHVLLLGEGALIPTYCASKQGEQLARHRGSWQAEKGGGGHVRGQLLLPVAPGGLRASGEIVNATCSSYGGGKRGLSLKSLDMLDSFSFIQEIEFMKGELPACWCSCPVSGPRNGTLLLSI